MKRITVEAVKAAYEKTGLKPIRHRFGDGETCGCPLTAIVVADGRDPADAARLGDNDSYGIGFVRGVDNREANPEAIHPPLNDKRAFRQGYTDGAAVRVAMFQPSDLTE